MNTQLVDYGILQEESDYRVHVGPRARKVYWFKTQEAVDYCEGNDIPKHQTYTDGIVTAIGYTPYWQDIPNIQSADPPEEIWIRLDFSRYDAPSVKGEKAELVYEYCVNKNIIVLPMKGVQRIEDVETQLRGIDCILIPPTVQIKCDYYCGDGPGCTGNLYLQVSECNPHSSH